MENQFRNDDERAQYHHDDDARYKLDFRSTYLFAIEYTLNEGEGPP